MIARDGSIPSVATINTRLNTRGNDMIIAHKIATKHDVNGNPRRGYHVFKSPNDGNFAYYLGFVDEGYGNSAREMRNEFPGIVFLGTVTVTPGEYRTAKRNETSLQLMHAKADAMDGN
jgi:hypothetical protein